MKDAYSNLLGEFVGATEVDYDDLAGFQIVCPCCRDAIFKVHRDLEGRSVDFFSHYRASKDFAVEECERRVGGLSAGGRSAHNQQSRAQSLAAFRAVIRDAVAPLPIKGKVVKGGSIPSGSFIDDLVANVGDFVSRWSDTDLRMFVRENAEMLRETGSNSFSDSIRSRIAIDVLRTLYANRADRSVALLVGRGYLSCNSFDHGRGVAWLSGRAERLCAEFLRGHDFSDLEDGRRDGTDVVIATVDAVLRELYRLPYFKMLDNHRAGRPTMAGITLDDYLEDNADQEEISTPSPVP